MRTTLDIEDDVLSAAKELARRGLAATMPKQGNRSTMRAGVPVLPSRGEIVTLEHIQRLSDEKGV